MNGCLAATNANKKSRLFIYTGALANEKENGRIRIRKGSRLMYIGNEEIKKFNISL